MTETSVAPVAAAALGAVGVAPLTWWIALGLIPDEADPEDADFMVQPLDLSAGDRLTIGLVALGIVAVGLGLFASALRSGRVRQGWVGVLAPVVVFFAYVGLTYRVASAPTNGANIGGALLLMAGFVVVPVLAVVTLVYALRLRPEQPPPRRRGMAL